MGGGNGKCFVSLAVLLMLLAPNSISDVSVRKGCTASNAEKDPSPAFMPLPFKTSCGKLRLTPQRASNVAHTRKTLLGKQLVLQGGKKMSALADEAAGKWNSLIPVRKPGVQAIS